jgi:hypothetical protein
MEANYTSDVVQSLKPSHQAVCASFTFEEPIPDGPAINMYYMVASANRLAIDGLRNVSVNFTSGHASTA